MRINVLGVEFHPVSLEEAVTRASGWCESASERTTEGSQDAETKKKFHYVVTPNPEFILRAQKDPVFRDTLNRGDLVLPDGIGVIYSAKILGSPLPGRVPGIDFASGMLEQLNKTKGSVFLLGAKDGVAKEAGERLVAQYPDLVIAGVHHGYFKEDEDEAVAHRVAESKADVIFVCLGAPRQELFLAKWGDTMGVKVGVGLGGALDVFAGRIQRAPKLWQTLGLEWLYRLTKEPKRVGRMAKLPLVLVQAMNTRLFGKKRKPIPENKEKPVIPKNH